MERAIETYRNFVIRHAAQLGNLESYVRMLLLAVPGRFGERELQLEVASTALTWLCLVHDAIVAKYVSETLPMSHSNALAVPGAPSSSQAFSAELMQVIRERSFVPAGLQSGVMLTTALKSVEVLAEVWAARGPGGSESRRWTVIALVELAKLVVRLNQIARSGGSMLVYDCVAPMNRQSFDEQEEALRPPSPPARTVPSIVAAKDVSFETLVGDVSRLSPQALRKRGLARQSAEQRQAKLRERLNLRSTSTRLDRVALLGEIAYLARPLIYALAVKLLGRASWKALGLSFLLDLVWMRTHLPKIFALQPHELNELSRRLLQLLLYFVRVPFYTAVTRRLLRPVFALLSYLVPATTSQIGELPDTHYFYTSAS